MDLRNRRSQARGGYSSETFCTAGGDARETWSLLARGRAADLCRARCSRILFYASSLNGLERFEEAKALLRKTIPVARRVLGENNENTLKLRWLYAEALFNDDGATLDDLREAVTTLEDVVTIARRVLGGAHPVVSTMEESLRDARAALRARETPSGNA